jgi:hypothetical protein
MGRLMETLLSSSRRPYLALDAAPSPTKGLLAAWSIMILGSSALCKDGQRSIATLMRAKYSFKCSVDRWES